MTAERCSVHIYKQFNMQYTRDVYIIDPHGHRWFFDWNPGSFLL